MAFFIKYLCNYKIQFNGNIPVYKNCNTKDQLGLEVLNAGIRDVILTGEMKEIMNQVLVAQKKAQVNIITRREEISSTRSLLNTAKLTEENEIFSS